METLELPECINVTKVDFDCLQINVSIFPIEGPFIRTRLDFVINICESYPFDPPKARLLQKVRLIHENGVKSSLLFA